jgi:hypothetical protein
MSGIFRTFLRKLGGKRRRRPHGRFAAGGDVGGDICEVLGLGEKPISHLVIDIPCDGLITITARVVATEQQTTELKRFLLDYRAEAAPEPDAR